MKETKEKKNISVKLSTAAFWSSFTFLCIAHLSWSCARDKTKWYETKHESTEIIIPIEGIRIHDIVLYGAQACACVLIHSYAYYIGIHWIGGAFTESEQVSGWELKRDRVTERVKQRWKRVHDIPSKYLWYSTVYLFVCFLVFHIVPFR